MTELVSTLMPLLSPMTDREMHLLNRFGHYFLNRRLACGERVASEMDEFATCLVNNGLKSSSAMRSCQGIAEHARLNPA